MDAKYNCITPDEKWSRYGYRGGEATYWKTWTVEKRMPGFAFGYLLLRELPIRNFYARGFIMIAYFSKFFDQYGIPYGVNGYGQKTIPVKVDDHWEAARETEVMDLCKTAASMCRIPTSNNKLPASLEWAMAQPGHYKTNFYFTTQNVGSKFGALPRQTYWDGTFNMPLNSLAHPLHKDAASILQF